ncbi:MAG: hypothetical protein LR011_00780, partial [Verrucomicrobia bacterium]|nr:hypothetical protein [Verrucomicrobiota bacterium]
GGLLTRSSAYNAFTGSWSTHDYYHADGSGKLISNSSTPRWSVTIMLPERKVYFLPMHNRTFQFLAALHCHSVSHWTRLPDLPPWIRLHLIQC